MGQDFLDIKYTDNVTDPLSGPIPSSKKNPTYGFIPTEKEKITDIKLESRFGLSVETGSDSNQTCSEIVS